MNGPTAKSGWLRGNLVRGAVRRRDCPVRSNSPTLNASTVKITQYYQNHHAGILVSELLINLASVVLLWFLGGLHANLRQRDEHGFLAPVVLGSGAATVALGMVSDLAGTVAGLLAGQHSLDRSLPDPGPARNQRWRPPGILPASGLTATLAVAILQGAIGARWMGWLSALSSAACLVSVVIGSLAPRHGATPRPARLLYHRDRPERQHAPPSFACTCGHARKPAGNRRAPVAEPGPGPLACLARHPRSPCCQRRHLHPPRRHGDCRCGPHSRTRQRHRASRGSLVAVEQWPASCDSGKVRCGRRTSRDAAYEE